MLWKNASISEFKDHLKIKNDDTARIVGVTPNYIGFQPSKPVTAINYASHYLYLTLKNKYSKSNVYEKFLDLRIQQKDVWSGGYDSNSPHLSQFFQKNVSNKRPSSKEIIDICRNNPWFNVPELDYEDPTEMFSIVNYNPKASPGLFFSKILRNNKKEFTKVMAYALALELYETIGTVATTNFSLWEVYAREKEVKIDSSKEPTTRLILNPEHHICILFSWIFQKFMDAVSYGNDNVKFLIHKEYDGLKSKKFYDNIIKKFDWVVDADWSLFDSSQTPEYLVSAISIMFANLDLKKSYNKRLIFFIIESTIKKFVAIPPGLVVECNKGMPSGHPGVTAINCYVNLIRWAIIGYEVYGDNYWDFMDLTVYGDDALVGFKNHPNLWRIDDICQDYGFSGDSIVDRLYPTNIFDNDHHGTPDFLKRRFNLDGVYWNREKLLNNIIFQSKNRHINLQIDLILGYIQTGPHDYEMNSILLDTLKLMIERERDLIDGEYLNKISNISIDFDRFSFFKNEHPLINIINEYNFIYNQGQIYVRDYTNSYNELELYNALHDFQVDKVKLLLRFTNTGEFLNFYYGPRKFFILKDILDNYFTRIDDYFVPSICMRRFNNFSLFDTS